MSQQAATLALSAGSRRDNGAQVSRVPPPAILMELVERFQVSWQRVPDASLLETTGRHIGFTLELCGSHEPRAKHSAESCIHCHNAFASLHVIADWVLSEEKRTLMSGAEVQAPCQVYSRAPQEWPDVCFSIRVVHRGVSDEVTEERMTQWFKDLEWRLSELGAVQRESKPQ